MLLFVFFTFKISFVKKITKITVLLTSILILLMLWGFFLLNVLWFKVILETESIWLVGSRKKVLNSYFLSKVLFPSLWFVRKFTFWKELVSLFYKSPPPFLTFVNCKGPYRGASSQHWSILWHCVCAIRSHPKNKEIVCWNSSCCRGLLNYNSLKKNKESIKQPFQICLSVTIYLFFMEMNITH